MKPVLQRGKLLIATMALAGAGLAASAAVTQPAQAAAHPAAAMSAHAQPGSPYHPPDPCDQGASSRQAGPGPAHPRSRQERRGNGPPGPAALRAWGIQHTAVRDGTGLPRSGPWPPVPWRDRQA